MNLDDTIAEYHKVSAEIDDLEERVAKLKTDALEITRDRAQALAKLDRLGRRAVH